MANDDTAAQAAHARGFPSQGSFTPQYPPGWRVQARRLLRRLATLRPHLWLHSVPYLLVWTANADALGRAGLVVAHVAALVAWQLRSDFIDAARGLSPRGGLPRQRRWTDLVFSDRAVPAALGLVLVGGLLAARLHPAVLLVAAALAAAGWFVPLRPPARKYLVVPEALLVLGFVGGTAAVLALAGTGSVDVATVVANGGALGAIVVAAHIRDRDRDLVDGIATVATRGPAAWTLLWLAGVGTAVAGLASLELPLEAGGRVAVGGIGAFVLALCLRRGRVPALVLAHGAYALGLLAETPDAL